MHSIYSVLAITASIGSVVQAQLQGCHAVQPSGLPSAQCGVRGTVDNRWAIANAAVVSSLEECASICESRRLDKKSRQVDSNYFCRSFYYDSDNNLCGIGGGDVKRSVQPDANSTRVFYSYRCFKCDPSFCNQAIGEELLYNGDFEKQPAGPWAYGAIDGEIGPGYQSNSGWQMDNYGVLGQSYNSCNDLMYKISFDYKITWDGQHYPTFRTIFANYYFLDQTSANVGWKSITGFSRGGGGGPLYISGGGNDGPGRGNNVYNVDNVQVSRFPFDPATEPLAQPAFRNAGFESGKLAPWSLTYLGEKPSYSVASPGLNGSNKAFFVDLTEPNGFMTLSQTMQAKPDTSYLVLFDYNVVKMPGATSPACLLELDYAAGSNVVYAGSRQRLTFDYGAGTFSYPIFLPSAQMEANFTFLFGEAYNVTLDNFRLEEIIE